MTASRANASPTESNLANTSELITSLQRSALLSTVPGVRHGVTRRVSGLGKSDGNVGYGVPRDRDDAWNMRKLWFDAAGLDARQIVVAHQMHGSGVIAVAQPDAGSGADPGSKPVGQADALITQEPGVVLMTLHADCLALLLCDSRQRAVAAVHAGWRGTVLDVAGATIREMACRYNSRPKDLLAYIGPAIGGCCYEVGDDVHNAWAQIDGVTGVQAIRPVGDRWIFDLAAANRALLERAGVRSDHIEASGICTRCGANEWFSHRGQGAGTGRYGSFIALSDS